MTTNKIQGFFCHSCGCGDQVVIVALLIALFWITAASPAFAIICVDQRTGIAIDVDAAECPPGITDDGNTTGNQGGGPITTFSGLLNHINSLLNAFVPFLIGLAVLVIIWGIFGYIRHSADEEKRGEARKYILWGVIFVFIMLSIWGFVNILVNTVPLQKKPPKVESVFPQ